jgi:hypothetical protein
MTETSLDRTVEIPFVVELGDPASEFSRSRCCSLMHPKLRFRIQPIVDPEPRVRANAIGRRRVRYAIHLCCTRKSSSSSTPDARCRLAA